MAKIIRIDPEVYAFLLKKKAEYEAEEQVIISFSEVVRRLLAAPPAKR